MKRLKLICAMLLSAAIMANGRTLVAFYSFTGNSRTIATELQTLAGADILEIEPEEEGLDYAANNYALGSSLIAAIRDNPSDAAAYPAIKPTNVSLADYDTLIIVTPLWWSNMAAPMQTFLFSSGAALASKTVGLIVSSHSSGISSVESDAKRLVANGNFLGESLWIKSSQTANCRSMLQAWMADNWAKEEQKLYITVNGTTLAATLADNSSAEALVELLKSGAITIEMDDYAQMEKVGNLPETLPRNDEDINTEPGDIILYLGYRFVIYYDTNSYSLTRLGKIDNATAEQLRQLLGTGGVTATLSLSTPTAVKAAKAHEAQDQTAYNLEGRRLGGQSNKGIYIIGKKIVNK